MKIIDRLGAASLFVIAPWVWWEVVSRLWPEGLIVVCAMVTVWAAMSLIRAARGVSA